MNRIVLFVIFIFVFSACSKNDADIPEIHPEMVYTNLGETEIKYGKVKNIDIDGDGKNDFLFETVLVGDPLMQQDKLQFYADSKIDAYLLNNAQEETPGLNKNEHIGFQHPGYEWNQISALVLVEKVTGITGPPFWRGSWKDAVHRYLPVQVKRNGQDFLGWIELSFDIQGHRMILHRAAICKTSGVPVRAGI